ncbi:MAG: signal recognition particle protein, partial [Actinobacteria bacterium]|nr:signal recognition particle protein [Actinomycetota bacterium]
MFEGLTEKFSRAFSSLRGKGRISESDIESALSEIRSALLEADVALEVVDSFTTNVREKSLTKLADIQRSTNPSQEIFSVI